MFKKRLWLSVAPIVFIPLIVACSQPSKVESFKNDEGVEITYKTNIDLSLLAIKTADNAETKEDLVVGNFTSTDAKTVLEYSFNEDGDSAFFRVDNSNSEKIIYLKKEKFQELINSKKDSLSITTKATIAKQKNSYIEKTETLKIDTVTDVQKISLEKLNNEEKIKPTQELDFDTNFKVNVNLENRDRKGTIVNTDTDVERISILGAFDRDQDTFYAPIKLSDPEKIEKESRGLSAKAEIILEAKSEEGVYVSMLEAYFIALSDILDSGKSSFFSVSYQKMDDKMEEVKNIEDSRLDLELRERDPKPTRQNPSSYSRGLRYIPIYEKVKKIIFSFNDQEDPDFIPYLSELKIMGQVLTNYTQEPGTQLLDHKFASYLKKTNETLYKENNVTMGKKDSVTFNFKAEDSVKLKQIQLYKAPVAYEDENQTGPVWKIRQGSVSKYRYVVTFNDKTKVAFDIEGMHLPTEIFQLPEKYQDKSVLSVELISDTLIDLKEVVFV